MNTLQSKDLNNLIKDLAEALYKFSDARLDTEESMNIAKVVIEKIDFDNSSLTHKGVNWYAKELIDSIDFSVIAYS